MSTIDRKMRERLRVLFALVKGARKSDRELSRILGRTVTSVTRNRRELEQEGLIQEYIAVPDFEKLGFGVEAFTFVSTVGTVKSAQLENLRRSTRGCSCTLFAGGGEGLGANLLIVSLHMDYGGYLEFVKSLRAQSWLCGSLQDVKSFVMSTDRSHVLVPFSFRDLREFKFGIDDSATVSGWITPLSARVRNKSR